MTHRILAPTLFMLCILMPRQALSQDNSVYSGQDSFSKIMNARNEKDWNRLVIFAQTNPNYFSCNYPNLLLSQAEAYHELGNDSQALGVYSNILARCKDLELLKMAYEQAIVQLEYSHLSELFSQGKTLKDPVSRGQLEQMRLNYLLSRLRVAIVSGNIDLAKQLDGDALTIVEDLRETNSAEVVAWKYLDASMNPEASRWFDLLAKLGGLTKNTELGRSLALQRANEKPTKPISKPSVASSSSIEKAQADKSPQPRKVTGQSKAALFKERELWQLFGDSKYKQAAAEIKDFKQLMPNWQVPPKMTEILEEQAYKSEIQEDEISLWALLEKRDYAELDTTIKRMTKRFPKWRPPAKLVEIRDRNVIGDQISAALHASDWASFKTYHDKYPQYLNCDRIDFMWGDADYHTVRSEWSEVHKIYTDILRNCTLEHKRITLQRVFDHLPDDELEKFITSARRDNTDTNLSPDLLEAAYRVRIKQLNTAVSNQNYAEAATLSGRVEKMATEKKDPIAAGLFGWTQLNLKKHKDASQWFEKAMQWGDDQNPDLTLGYLLSLHAGGELERAALVVDRIEAPNEKIRRVGYDTYSALSWAKYEEKSYRETLALLEKMERYGIPTRDEHILKAWALKELGQKPEAERLLEKLRYQRENGRLFQDRVPNIPFPLHLQGKMKLNNLKLPSWQSVRG